MYEVLLITQFPDIVFIESVVFLWNSLVTLPLLLPKLKLSFKLKLLY